MHLRTKVSMVTALDGKNCSNVPFIIPIKSFWPNFFLVESQNCQRWTNNQALPTQSSNYMAVFLLYFSSAYWSFFFAAAVKSTFRKLYTASTGSFPSCSYLFNSSFHRDLSPRKRCKNLTGLLCGLNGVLGMAPYFFIAKMTGPVRDLRLLNRLMAFLNIMIGTINCFGLVLFWSPPT